MILFRQFFCRNTGGIWRQPAADENVHILTGENYGYRNYDMRLKWYWKKYIRKALAEKRILIS